MSKKKQRNTTNKDKLSYMDIQGVRPLTDNQEAAIRAFDDGQNLIMSGSAGTGKTYVGLALALEEVLNPATQPKNIIILRSAVATREIGFLPGTVAEKMSVFYGPYQSIVNDITPGGWTKAIDSKLIKLESTSFVRGATWDDTIIVVDEMQNMNFHELDSIITRLGINSRLILCGDYYQTDFQNPHEKEGVNKFLDILNRLPSFSRVNFTTEDIVRSDLVKDYIIAKEKIV